MADNQGDPPAASDPTQVTEDSLKHTAQDVAKDQATGGESKASSASQPRSAADSYHEAASKIFEAPQNTSGEPGSSDDVTDTNQQLPEGAKVEGDTVEDGVQEADNMQEISTEDVSQGISVAELSAEKSSQEHSSKVEDISDANQSPQIKVEDGGSQNGTKEDNVLETAEETNDAHLSPADNVVTKVTDKQEQTEHPNGESDTNLDQTSTDQNSQVVSHSANNDENDHTTPEQNSKEEISEKNNEQIIEHRTNDNAQPENVDELVISGEKIISTDESRRLSEDEIIQRLQDVNQEVYNNDIDEGITVENELPNEPGATEANLVDTSNNMDRQEVADNNKTFDATENTFEIDPSGDAMQSGAQTNQNGGVTSAGGDAESVLSNPPDPVSDQEGMAPSENRLAVMSEIMSEDLDALRVDQEAMYQDYARQEQAAQDAAKEQEHGKQHVTYAGNVYSYC